MIMALILLPIVVLDKNFLTDYEVLSVLCMLLTIVLLRNVYIECVKYQSN